MDRKTKTKPRLKPLTSIFIILLWPFQTIWNAICFILSLKVFPLVWHLRVLSSILFRYRLNKTPIPPPTLATQPVFQPTIWKSSTPLGELDFLGHKSNGTYLTDFDAARTYHLSSVLRMGLHKWSKNPGGLMPLYPVLGGIECSFRRSIKPGQKYHIVTRILGWNEKWIFVVSHFVEEGCFQPGVFSDGGGIFGKRIKKMDVEGEKKAGVDAERDLEKGNCDESGGNGRDPVFAVAMAKMVFKNGRKTISPMQTFSDCELVPAVEENGPPGSVTVVKPAENDDDARDDGPRVNAIDQQMVIAKVIEEKRLRGLEIAQSINSSEQGIPFDIHEDVAFSKF